MEPPLAIDPELTEAEGITHSSPAVQNGTRSGRARAHGASAMNTIRDETGAYVLVPSNQSNGQDGGEEPPSTSGLEPPPKVKRPRGRPRKSRDGEGADGSPAKPKKRKPRNKAKDDGELDDVGESEERPQKRLKTAGKDDDSQTAEDGIEELPESGPLTKTEQRILDDIMKMYRDGKSLQQRDVNEMIQNTNRAQSEQTKELWGLLYDALPQRPHVSVMRATRRRYHNYEIRGKWTPADDETLKEAHAAHPGKWVKIGSILKRMPEDCRDRWRNYLSCGDERKTDDWNEAEEKELYNAVQECMGASRQEAKDRAKEQGHAFREQDWETYVNFNTVSEKMRHTRSRLQCYTHWRVMQKRAGADEPEGASAKKSESKNPTRQARALAKYEKMTPVEKFHILRQIAESDAREEDDINWKALSRQDAGSKWSTRERKEAFAKMKELVPPQETLRDTIEVLCGYLVTTYPDQLQLMGPVVDDDGFDADATQALLQQEIDASPSIDRLVSRSTAVGDMETMMEGVSEQDIQDLNVARALQGIAQLSQERGDFADAQMNSRQPEDLAADEQAFAWSTKAGKKRSSQRV